MGRGQEAVSYLNAKTLDEPHRKKGQLVMGKMALEASRLSEAQRYLEAARSSLDHSTRGEAQILLAQLHEKMGNREEARRWCMEYLASFPRGRYRAWVLLRLGRMDLEKGKIAESTRWVREALFQFRFEEPALAELGDWLLMLSAKDRGQFLTFWNAQSFRFLHPHREPFLRQMAEALKESGTPYLRLHQWLTQYGSGPTRLQSRIVLTRHQIQNGDLKGAEQNLRELKKIPIAAKEVRRLEAELFQAQGDFHRAAQTLVTLGRLEPQDLSRLQEILSLGGDDDKILKILEKNIQGAQGNPLVLLRLADGYFSKGKKKEALSYYQRVLENDPLNPWAAYRAGILLGGEEGRQLLVRAKDDQTLIGKCARIGLREMEIRRKLEDPW